MIYLVIIFLIFIFISAPLGWLHTIQEGLESSRKPLSGRTYKDNDKMYDMRATIISIVIGILIVLWTS